MTLDDLQERWQQHEAKLDAVLASNASLLRATTLNGTRTALDRAARRVTFEWLATLAAVLLLGAFAADHAGETLVVCSAALLDAYAVAATAAGIAVVVRLRGIDYGAAVATTAQDLEGVALLRARAVFWTLAAAPFMWTPLLVVIVRAVFGAGTLAGLSPLWIGANVVFGVEVLAAALVFARRRGDAAETNSGAERLWRMLSGRDIRTAAERLAALRDDVADSAS